MDKYCIFDYDKKCTDFKMILTERKVKAIPNITINELDIGSKNGSIPTRIKIGKNSIKITIECFAKPNEVYNNIREFINYLNPLKGEKKISFSDELDKYRLCMLSNGDDVDYFYSQYLTFGKFTLEFIMFDPYTYSNKTKKYYYNGKNGATAKLINNGGDECPVKIKVYAPKGIDIIKYEENHANVVYVGDWSVYSTSYFSGGKSKFSNYTGSSATLSFYGTAINLYGLKSLGKGIANIYIDDELVQKADCYAESEQWSVLLFSASNLENKSHKIKVEVSGEKNDNAVGYQINIDYFEVLSSSIASDILPLEMNGEIFSYTTIPTISNVKIAIGKEYIMFSSSINPTDEVIIDTKEYKMKLNNMNALSKWQGDFPNLLQGENIIKVTDTNSQGALVIFEFNERWL